MASTFRVNNRQIKFAALVPCDACEGMHIVVFSTQAEFESAYCPLNNSPFYASQSDYAFYYRKFQESLLSEAVAV